MGYGYVVDRPTGNDRRCVPVLSAAAGVQGERACLPSAALSAHGVSRRSNAGGTRPNGSTAAGGPGHAPPAPCVHGRPGGPRSRFHPSRYRQRSGSSRGAVGCTMSPTARLRLGAGPRPGTAARLRSRRRSKALWPGRPPPAPEQAQGHERLDPRSDIYSLGATAYFLVTGRGPFAASRSHVAVLAAHICRSPGPANRPARGGRPTCGRSCCRAAARIRTIDPQIVWRAGGSF